MPIDELSLLMLRIAVLEDRLAKLEAKLGAFPAQTAPATAEPKKLATEAAGIAPKSPPAFMPKPEPQLETTEEARRAAKLAETLRPPERTPSAKAPREEAVEEAAWVLPVAEVTPPPPPRKIAWPPVQEPGPERPSRGSLEQTIGLQWAGWIGAIVLVIGAGLGIKYAYDHGWLERLSPQVRLLLQSLGGFLLLAAGEVVYRRINKISAAGLFGAGVGLLFFVGYRAHEFYSAEIAFLLFAAVTLIGAGVAIRGNLVSIAVLSLIGGHLAPVLLSTDQEPGVPFFTYLFMLQAVALVLAWWGNTPKWWTLRGFSLGATTFWLVAVFMSEGISITPLADEKLWFTLLYAVAYQVELLWSALRLKPAPEIGTSESARDRSEEGWGTAFSMLVTAGLTAAALFLLQELDPGLRGAWVLIFAAACAVPGLALAKHENVRVRNLAAAYRIQAVALVTLWVPVALSGVWISLAWGILSLTFAAHAAKFDRNVTRVGSMATWILAIAHLTIKTADATSGDPILQTWFTVNEHPIHAYTVIAWLLAVGGQGAAWLVQSNLSGRERTLDPIWNQSTGLMSVAASAVWLVASVGGLPTLGATFAIIVWAWLIVGASYFTDRLHFAIHGVTVLVFAVVKWLIVDTLSRRLDPTWNPEQYIPVLNPVMGMGLLLAASLGGVLWLRRGALQQSLDNSVAVTPGTFLFGLIGLVVALATIGLSFEIDRAVQQAVVQGVKLLWPAGQLTLLGLTILWALAAVALGLAARPAPHWRALAWLLLALLIVKFLTVDTLIWRVDRGVVPALVVVNLQIATATILLGAMAALWYLSPLKEAQSEFSVTLPKLFVLLAALIIAWSGMLEIDRAVEGTPRLVERFAFPAWHLKQMGWTIWWVLVALGFLAGLRRFSKTVAPGDRNLAGWVIVAAVAAKFLIVDSLFPRLDGAQTGPLVLANFQMFTAAVALGGLVMLRKVAPLSDVKKETAYGAAMLASVLAVLIPLCAGTLEIDRAFSRGIGITLQDTELAKRAAISIFWSLYAVGLVAAGFGIRAAWLRYFGLGLFAVTLAKVGAIDLQDVEEGYRILSCIGLGLLLLGTSVLYGKVSPVLLRDGNGS